MAMRPPTVAAEDEELEVLPSRRVLLARIVVLHQMSYNGPSVAAILSLGALGVHPARAGPSQHASVSLSSATHQHCHRFCRHSPLRICNFRMEAG